jgi:hypothetical protein
MGDYPNEAYVKSAISGIARDIQQLQPGTQGTELYKHSVRAGCLIAERQTHNLLPEIERALVEAALVSSQTGNQAALSIFQGSGKNPK